LIGLFDLIDLGLVCLLFLGEFLLLDLSGLADPQLQIIDIPIELHALFI
jgi:hypothetical protein